MDTARAGPAQTGPRSKRQVWLERELSRLIKETHRVADENHSLKEDLFRLEGRPAPKSSAGTSQSPATPVSPEQITIENVTNTDDMVRMASGAEDMENETYDLTNDDKQAQLGRANSMMSMMAGKMNTIVIKGSALGLARPLQFGIYILAVCGVLFVLVGIALNLGGEDPAEVTDSAVADEHHRLLGGGGGGEAEPTDTKELMKNIAVSLTGCGLVALAVNLLNLPLILGYLLGGVLVGPIGLGIVPSHVQIAELSSMGLIFLLFMIGLELDVKALLKMGKVVLLTGALQFPICAGIQIMIFTGLQGAGLSFGTGPYAAMYVGMVCGISSTMIVVKLLSEKGELDSQPGRLTIGILIFQDIWAIVVLAIQPNLASPEIVGILRTFAMIGVLICLALLYAKFIMPAVLYHTSKNLELMLVMSLAWCFFICVVAILPFVGLSMELASLIAGVALATFPYSAEFNGKIKYIRDFFITLFFAGLGMQIPVPTPLPIVKGILVGIIVLLFRWLGIFFMVVILGGGTRLGAIATINLSQISEFALVICSLGMGFGHINADTMTIIIWCFAILAISASYLIGMNALIYDKCVALSDKIRGKVREQVADGHGGHDHHDERDIVLLGYHKIAFMLVAEIKAKSPQLLKRMHIIDFNQAIMPKLRELGLQCTYGDIGAPDVLEHAHHGEPKIVISTIPDSMLRGITNCGLVKVSKQVWPDAHVIVTADNPEQAAELYKAGADYVLRMAKLCADRLHELLDQNRKAVFGGGELSDIFAHFKSKDRELHGAKGFIGGEIF